MDDVRWRQIDQLLEKALVVPQDRRSTFLRRQCVGDESLHRAVKRLLALEAEAEGFLAEPVGDVRAWPVESLDGCHVGPYRLLRLLGRGGMGSVYLARREEDYQQEVAIKIVGHGPMSEEIHWRFRQERQILAQLVHPNIVRLYDGGTTADGCPYLVMELVAGLPIDRFCDQYELQSRDRLMLFRQVCAAMGYVHAHRFVHCDLKPSNILVTADRIVKILDFGIARLLCKNGTDRGRSRLGRPMTPGYASPEQLKGQPITTSSDLYALGVLLHKLLCGNLPRHKAGGAKLDPGLRGALEAIVLKALATDLQRRYATAEELSADIAVYLGVSRCISRRAEHEKPGAALRRPG